MMNAIAGTNLSLEEFSGQFRPLVDVHMGGRLDDVRLSQEETRSLIERLVDGDTPEAVAIRVESVRNGELYATVGADSAGGGSVTVGALVATLDDEGSVASLLILVPMGHAIVPDGITANNRADAPDTINDGITIYPFTAAKRVDKHWGREHWLHTDEDEYGFKIIRLKPGKRTSLQYHRSKSETYLILSGLARLHYESRSGEVDAVDFPAGTYARVLPMALHRVEAVTDVVLIEASTFDDGTDNIRVEDDLSRGDGLIESEHASAASPSA